MEYYQYNQKPIQAKVRRHKWTNNRSAFRSMMSECAKCGVQRNKRFDGTHHWIEYKLGDGDGWEKRDKTPECSATNTVKRKRNETLANSKGWHWSEELKKWVKTQELQQHDPGRQLPNS